MFAFVTIIAWGGQGWHNSYEFIMGRKFKNSILDFYVLNKHYLRLSDLKRWKISNHFQATPHFILLSLRPPVMTHNNYSSKQKSVISNEGQKVSLTHWRALFHCQTPSLSFSFCLVLEVEVGMVQAAIQVTGCLKSEDKEIWIMRCLLIETKMHFSWTSSIYLQLMLVE